LAAALPLSLLSVARTAVAEEADCGNKVTGKIVHYLEKSVAHGDPRCDPWDLLRSECKVDLQGVVYTPHGGGKHPVVLFNHGAHGANYCAVAKVFTNHGYLFFVPFRRGHEGEVDLEPGVSRRIRSTGVDTVDVLDKIESQDQRLANISVGPFLENATEDVRAALDFVKHLPGADPNKVAVAGHSYGGMMTLMAAADVPGFKAALDISGGCLSWNWNPDLQVYLKALVQRIPIPVFAFQDDQECSNPTKTLSQLLPEGSEHKIYPFPKMECHDAHTQFLMFLKGQTLWRQDALDFLKKHNVAP
jgi:dienelactone hydrolase